MIRRGLDEPLTAARRDSCFSDRSWRIDRDGRCGFERTLPFDDDGRHRPINRIALDDRNTNWAIWTIWTIWTIWALDAIAAHQPVWTIPRLHSLGSDIRPTLWTTLWAVAAFHPIDPLGTVAIPITVPITIWAVHPVVAVVTGLAITAHFVAIPFHALAAISALLVAHAGAEATVPIAVAIAVTVPMLGLVPVAVTVAITEFMLGPRAIVHPSGLLFVTSLAFAAHSALAKRLAGLTVGSRVVPVVVALVAVEILGAGERTLARHAASAHTFGATLLELLLAVCENYAIVMLSVLQVVLGQDVVTGRERISRQRHVLFRYLGRSSVNLLVGAVRLIRTHQRVVVMLALAVLILVLVVVIVVATATTAVLLSLPHGTLFSCVTSLQWADTKS